MPSSVCDRSGNVGRHSFQVHIDLCGPRAWVERRCVPPIPMPRSRTIESVRVINVPAQTAAHSRVMLCYVAMEIPEADERYAATG